MAGIDGYTSSMLSSPGEYQFGGSIWETALAAEPASCFGALAAADAPGSESPSCAQWHQGWTPEPGGAGAGAVAAEAQRRERAKEQARERDRRRRDKAKAAKSELPELRLRNAKLEAPNPNPNLIEHPF